MNIKTGSYGVIRRFYCLLSFSHLAQNPFVCDCGLKWLADFLRSNPIETSGARCSSPRRLANKRISQIKSKKFRCSGTIHKHTVQLFTNNYLQNIHFFILNCAHNLLIWVTDKLTLVTNSNKGWDTP